MFYPNNAITREDMTYFFWKYALAYGYDDSYTLDKYSAFTDTNAISSYAVPALMWATTHGVIKGDAGKIDPQGQSTRAEVAQVFLNFSAMMPITSPPPVEPSPSQPVDPNNYNPVYEIPTGKSAVDADGGYYDYDLANEIMKQINELRAEYGLNPLLYNPTIQSYASIRAKEQTVLVGHTRPDGTMYDSVQEGAGALQGENITNMYSISERQMGDTAGLAARAVNNWFASTKGHKEMMLNSHRYVAAVSCYVKDGSIFIVHLFSQKSLYWIEYIH